MGLVCLRKAEKGQPPLPLHHHFWGGKVKKKRGWGPSTHRGCGEGAQRGQDPLLRGLEGVSPSQAASPVPKNDGEPVQGHCGV